MAIHAKTNGLLVGGRIIEETESHWRFHAMDEKRPKYIQKSDPNNQVFDGDTAADDAIDWQLMARTGKK